MRPYTAEPGRAWGLGPGPFLFSGRPPLLAGSIEVFNTADERVKIRAIATAEEKGAAATAVGLDQLQLAARLEPGERAVVMAHFRVDPYCPPGRYELQLTCGDQREPVIAHVFRRDAISFSPRSVQLRGAPGDKVAHALIATNRGNTPGPVPEVTLAFLEESDWLGRALVDSLRKTEEANHQQYLDTLLQDLKQTLHSPVRVSVHGGGGDLMPGESREVQLEMQLPAKLVRGRPYFGWAPFMCGRLLFDVAWTRGASSKRRAT